MSNSITQRDLSPIIGQPEEHEGTNSLRIPPSQQQQSKLTPISNRLERLQEGSAIKNAQRQARVLQATEEFLEWPPHTQDAANPNGEDATKLKFLLCPFLPSDFDDAIQERNIAGRCGYMLCPKPNRKQPLKARYRLVIGKELIIVPKEELERWCSDECAERALYLRVQLSEYSLGERYTRDGTVFKLFNEGTQGEESEDHLHHAVEELAKGLGQLAVERGDRKLFDTNLVKGVIKERATTENTPIPPIFEQSYDSDFRRDISGRGQLTEHMEDGEIAKVSFLSSDRQDDWHTLDH